MIESRPNAVEKFFDNIIKQHNKLMEIGFPAAKILNADSAKRDGFIIMEKIPHKFEVIWDLNDTIDSLSETAIAFLTQAKMMFQLAFNEDIDVDIARENLHITVDGKVLLIDFMEEFQGTFQQLIEKHIFTFSHGNDNIRQLLLPKGYKRIEF